MKHILPYTHTQRQRDRETERERKCASFSKRKDIVAATGTTTIPELTSCPPRKSTSDRRGNSRRTKDGKWDARWRRERKTH